MKIIHGVTVPQSLGLMRGQLGFLDKQGFECIAVTSKGDDIESFALEENSSVRVIDMEREISLIKDAISLVKLISLFYKEKPKIINAGTPKAGLLMMIAAYITRVPIRIYTLRGLRLETTTGIKRKVLSVTEKIAMFCSTETLAISPSLRDKAIEYGFIQSDKIQVLGIGSSNGVEIDKFKETKVIEREINRIHKDYDIQISDFVIGFIGRITKDKGVEELIEVFELLLERNYNVKLLIVGDFDNGDPISTHSRRIIETHPRIIHIGFQKNPVPYFYIMKVFLFLTKREGFGNVSIEAALTKIPVIVKNVTGAKDTVIHNKTGYIIESNSVEEIVEKVIRVYENEELRRQLGNKGSEWVTKKFPREYIHSKLYDFYRGELYKHNITFNGTK